MRRPEQHAAPLRRCHSEPVPTTLFERPTLAQRVWLLRVLRQETVGGLLMLAAAIVAMVWANSQWASDYLVLIHTKVGPESLHLNLPINVWAADFLLAFFFYLAGLELKHEVVHGTLSQPAQAVVPIVAAVCGMAVPALIFWVVTSSDPVASHGWGIPMATDIAFALAVLAILGRGLPLALRAFLLTLAVVDDLGAITVIAIFYSDSFHSAAFAGALACVVAFWLIQQRWRRRASVMALVPLAGLTWYLTHESGVHATVAGVALGLVTRVSQDSHERRSPAESAEHALRPFVAGIAVPVFAFTAAGVPIVPIDGGQEAKPFLELLGSPVALGVMLGLLLGKPIGVVGGSWLVARFTRASLNPALRWADVGAVGFLAGIGFTVSLLIAELAYAEHPVLLTESKVGIIMATVGAALISGAALAWRRHALAEVIDEEEADLDADGIPDVYQDPGALPADPAAR